MECKDQEEIDYYWNKLTADGGQESKCGWLKDKFGVSWQIVPSVLGKLMTGACCSQGNAGIYENEKIHNCGFRKSCC